MTQLTDLVIFPPGAFKGAFPDGVIGNPDVYERHWRLGVSSLYTGFAGHQIRLGMGFNHANLYKVREMTPQVANAVHRRQGCQSPRPGRRS